MAYTLKNNRRTEGAGGAWGHMIRNSQTVVKNHVTEYSPRSKIVLWHPFTTFLRGGGKTMSCATFTPTWGSNFRSEGVFRGNEPQKPQSRLTFAYSERHYTSYFTIHGSLVTAITTGSKSKSWPAVGAHWLRWWWPCSRTVRNLFHTSTRVRETCKRRPVKF